MVSPTSRFGYALVTFARAIEIFGEEKLKEMPKSKGNEPDISNFYKEFQNFQQRVSLLKNKVNELEKEEQVILDLAKRFKQEFGRLPSEYGVAGNIRKYSAFVMAKEKEISQIKKEIKQLVEAL
mgnify:CR=1 FL=1